MRVARERPPCSFSVTRSPCPSVAAHAFSLDRTRCAFSASADRIDRDFAARRRRKKRGLVIKIETDYPPTRSFGFERDSLFPFLPSFVLPHRRHRKDKRAEEDRDEPGNFRIASVPLRHDLSRRIRARFTFSRSTKPRPWDRRLFLLVSFTHAG